MTDRFVSGRMDGLTHLVRICLKQGLDQLRYQGMKVTRRSESSLKGILSVCLLSAQAQHRLHENRRCFLRQVVAYTRQYLALVGADEVFCITIGLGDRVNTVIMAVQDNSGHSNRGLRRQLSFNAGQCRVAGHIAVAMAVGMNHHLDKIGVCEGRGAALEGGLIKTPSR